MNQIFIGPGVLLIAVFISIYISHCMLDWPISAPLINLYSSGPVQFTIYELTNGIETPLLFIIEAIYFHRFKRLNRFIYSSFTWFINRAYNHILVYYHNLFLVYLISLNYVTRYYRPNVLEIGIGYNFYILSGLFAISSDN